MITVNDVGIEVGKRAICLDAFREQTLVLPFDLRRFPPEALWFVGISVPPIRLLALSAVCGCSIDWLLVLLVVAVHLHIVPICLTWLKEFFPLFVNVHSHQGHVLANVFFSTLFCNVRINFPILILLRIVKLRSTGSSHPLRPRNVARAASFSDMNAFYPRRPIRSPSALGFHIVSLIVFRFRGGLLWQSACRFPPRCISSTGSHPSALQFDRSTVLLLLGESYGSFYFLGIRSIGDLRRRLAGSLWSDDPRGAFVTITRYIPDKSRSCRLMIGNIRAVSGFTWA